MTATILDICQISQSELNLISARPRDIYEVPSNQSFGHVSGYS